ncbi:MAG TPA: cobalamin biosynthesis protein, partial [Rubrobacteraceae bacterium]
MIGLVAVTSNGRCRTAYLAEVWEEARLYEGKPKEALAAAWEECDQIVLFLATGAAVRLVAPLLGDKRRDPGVVCVDDAGRFAVALCGGHEGGANALAERIAETLGATPVVTTASDSLGVPALDSLGKRLGFEVEEGSDLAAVGAALVSGETVRLVSERRWPLGPLPENVVLVEPKVWPEEIEPPLLEISDRLLATPHLSVVYRPPSLVAGVGCTRGADAAEILDLLDSALHEAGLSQKSVAVLASVDVKSDEAGLLEAADALGVPLHFHSAEELAAVETPNPSPVVAGAVGTPSVAEASVLVSGAELLLEKRKSANATVAIGRLPVR